MKNKAANDQKEAKQMTQELQNNEAEADIKRSKRLNRAGAILGGLWFLTLPLGIWLFGELGLLVWILLGLPAGLLKYRADQYNSRAKARKVFRDAHSHTQAVLEDGREPIIYLRSFEQDASLWSFTLVGFRLRLTVLGLLGQTLQYPLVESDPGRFDEESLQKVMSPIGPVLAMGQPGERLPRPGVVRAYAGDDEWQKVVGQWLSAAQLVLVRAGATKSLWWEIRQAMATVSPDRFLILMFANKRPSYEAFSERMREVCGVELPPFKEVQRWRNVSGFFEFQNDWTPHFLPLRAPYWRTSFFGLYPRLFYYTLRPVFLRLGVSWRPPSIAVSNFFLLPYFVLAQLIMVSSIVFGGPFLVGYLIYLVGSLIY